MPSGVSNAPLGNMPAHNAPASHGNAPMHNPGPGYDSNMPMASSSVPMDVALHMKPSELDVLTMRLCLC